MVSVHRPKRGFLFASIYVVLVFAAFLALLLLVRRNAEYIDYAPFLFLAITLPWSVISLAAPESILVYAVAVTCGFLLNVFGLYWLGARTTKDPTSNASAAA